MGSEISKTRPAVIVNDNTLGRLPLKIVVSLTDWKDRYAAATWMVRVLPNRVNSSARSPRLIASRCVQGRRND